MSSSITYSNAGLLDALPSPALVLDDQGLVQAINRRWNDSGEACLGLSQPIEPGMDLLAWMGTSPEAASDTVQSLVAGIGSVIRGERQDYRQQFICHVDADGEPHWMRLDLRSFDEPSGGRHVLLTREDVTAEYRTDRALLESESRYHAVVEDQLELICRFLPDTTLTFVNQAYCDSFGQSPDELIGRRFLELVPESEWPGIEASLAAFTPDRHTLAYEHAVRMPDGTTAWQTWTDRAFFDERGRVIEFQSVGRDITRLKQVELALRESETRFNQLADHLDSVFWIFDWESRKLVYVSQAFAAVFGREVSAILDDARLWIESVHPDDHAHVLDMFRVGDREPFDLTYRIVRPDGEIRWLRDRGYPVHDDDGRVVRLVGLAEDVTERLTVEQKVQRSEERYRAASEAGLDSFYLFDAMRDGDGEVIDFVFTDLNRRGAEMVSRSREEVIGQRLLELLPVNRSDQFFGVYKQVVETGEPYYDEFPIDAPQQGIQANWMERQVVRVGDGIAISARDITARKLYERETAQQREENQRILDAIPAFVFYKDTNNRILRVNRAVCEAEGLPAEQIEGRHSAELYPEMAEAFHRDDLAVIRSGQAKLGYVEKLPGVNGAPDRWIRTDKVPIYDKDQTPAGVMAIATDVTELKETTERLRESEERYRGLFDRVPVSVWEQDLSAIGAWLDGLRCEGVADLSAYLDQNPESLTQAKRLTKVRGVNQATFELFGAESLDRLKAMLRDPRLGPPDEPWLLKLETIWSGQSSAEMETHCYTIAGRKLHVLFRLEIPEIDGRLDLSRAIIALTDISANRQRVFAQAQVTQAERERRMLGHELHDTLAQQLTGLNMLAETVRRRLASRGIPEVERVAELVKLVDQANKGVRRLISGLSAERIAADELETALESLAERTTLVHQLPVTFHCPRTPDELDEESANHLLFIAQEATHNAAKHAQASTIRITLDQSEDHLRLAVRDDGRGLPAPERRTTGPDSGLGLGIMRFRAEAIGATIRFESNMQTGTLVTCDLPTSSASRDEAQPHRSGQPDTPNARGS